LWNAQPLFSGRRAERQLFSGRQAVQLLFFFSHQVGQLQICPLLHVLQIDLCESFDHLKPLKEY
jgi:hypothetical protein